jgi:CheY-like chemotaxis protein
VRLLRADFLRLRHFPDTAYPDEVVRDRALKDGVVCYLSKPVDDDHLEQWLRSALQPGAPIEKNS